MRISYTPEYHCRISIRSVISPPVNMQLTRPAGRERDKRGYQEDLEGAPGKAYQFALSILTLKRQEQ
jgi:hypothetical protein